ncbi:MAG: glucosaminidase domain-containing protein, partial [Lachnospiraceae bacterium]|nr:glucosaminidase domain-containing protein [Lachnospiraceae bacterium]
VLNEYGWWYIENGKVDFTYDGLGTNEHGTWYIEDARVDFNKNGIFHRADGWYYFRGGKVDFSLTTVAKNANGWWYVKNGKVDFSANTVAENANGWWYIKSGKVDFSYHGFGTNEQGTWYMKSGRIDFSVNGLAMCGDTWGYFEDGKLNENLTDFVTHEGKSYYVQNGKVDSNYSGLISHNGKEYYVENGICPTEFTGIVNTEKGDWYVQNGMVDYTYTGEVTQDNVSYTVIEGQAVKEGTSIMGTSDITVEQMVAYYNANEVYPAYYANSDAPTIETFCQMYLEECAQEGVNPEVAFCQAMLETGFMRFGYQVDISQYNFAGIGATDDGASGAVFPDVRTGIRAQIQHLKAYACDEPLNNACVDPRFQLVKRGSSPFLEWLGIQENPNTVWQEQEDGTSKIVNGCGWASSKDYGFNIRDKFIKRLNTY